MFPFVCPLSVLVFLLCSFVVSKIFLRYFLFSVFWSFSFLGCLYFWELYFVAISHHKEHQTNIFRPVSVAPRKVFLWIPFSRFLIVFQCFHCFPMFSFVFPLFSFEFPLFFFCFSFVSRRPPGDTRRHPSFRDTPEGRGEEGQIESESESESESVQREGRFKGREVGGFLGLGF